MLTAVPPNVPLVSGAVRGDSSPFLRFRLLLGFGPCGAQPDYGSRGWGFESSWAHEHLAPSSLGAHGPTLILGGADGAAITALSLTPAALVSTAGRYATGVARCPGPTFWTPSTTTRSPAPRPCSISQAPW